MSELERRLRAASRANAAAATSAHAPREVRRSIGRRRALLPSTAGVTGAVIVGVLATGGLGIDESTDPPTPSPTPDFTLDEGTRAYATVPLPDNSYDYQLRQLSGGQLCGSPTPQATTGSDSFTGAFDLPEHLDLDVSQGYMPNPGMGVDVTLTYDADDVLPAFAGGVTALLLDGGVVVAFADSFGGTPSTSFDRDQIRRYSWDWEGWLASCADDGAGPLPASGDYEMVFVSGVHNDLLTAVQWSLTMDQFMLPAAQDLALFAEGSYLCEQWHTHLNRQPLTCKPNAVVGFELDTQAGTATVPYNTSYYTRDVDVMFVSDPVPATLSGEREGFMSEVEMPIYEGGKEPICGDFYGYISSTGDVSGTWEHGPTAIEPGDTIVPALWPRSLGWATADMTVPASPRVWLLSSAQFDINHDEGGDGMVSTYFGHEVVGWLETQSSQSAVEIAAYDGPAPWPLTVTDVQWCDGAGPTDQLNLDTHDVSGLIAEPFTVTLNDGTSYDADSVALGPGPHF